jgi:Ca-activated chloride channel homolog
MPPRLFAAFVLGLAINPWSALAMDAEALYYDQDYQASYEAYDARLGEGGKHRSELEYSAGTAAFKTENYGQAAEHLGRAILADDESLRSKAYYNLGNTLFRLGQESEEQEEIEAQWQSAIDHYADAEALGGVMERSARHNREVVEKHLAALKGEEPPESDDQQQQQQQDQNQDGEEGEDQEQEQDGQQNQDGEQQQDSQDQKSGEEGQDQEGQDQQQPQDGQEQEGQEGEPQQEQQSQEGEEGEQEQEQQGKPGDEGKEEEQPSQSSQDNQDGEEGKQAQETKELDGEVKAADDKDQKPEGEPEAKEGPQKPSAYELTPDGKLSEAAARALLESLEGEEVKAPFEVRRSKQRRRVIRDW